MIIKKTYVVIALNVAVQLAVQNYLTRVLI